MTRKRIVLLAGLVMVGALWTVPPFAVIDDGSGGLRHAAIGHHPAWDPPTTAEADSLLALQAGPPEPGVPVRLRVKRNNVLLGLKTVLVVLVAATLAALPSRRTRGSRPPDS